MLRRFSFLAVLVLGLGFITVSAQTEPQKPMLAKAISKGVVNGSATSLPPPAYPAAARAVGASGAVNVEVTIDEAGNVVSANAVSGHPLLHQAAVEAAQGAKFKPTMLSGQAVKINGVIVYNFVGPSPGWTNVGFQFGTAEAQGIRAEIDLPKEFEAEKNQLISLIKLTPQEQMPHIMNTVSMIKARLNPMDLWHFEFGLAKAGVLNNKENDGAIFQYLEQIKFLSNRVPEGVKTYDTVRAEKLAKFVEKEKLSREDKDAIFRLLL